MKTHLFVCDSIHRRINSSLRYQEVVIDDRYMILGQLHICRVSQYLSLS